MTPLYLLGQDDWDEVQHDFSDHVMALMLASHDAISIVKETTIILSSRQSKWDVSWLFWSYDTIATGITWCHCCWCHMMSLASVSLSHNPYSIINGIIIFLGQDDMSEEQHDLFGHMMSLELASASCDANSIVNGIIALLRSRLSKWSATWLFWSCDTIGTSTASHDTDGIVNSTITFLVSRCSKWGAKWLFWSCYAIGTSVTWCWWHQCIPYAKMTEMRCNMTYLVMSCHCHRFLNHDAISILSVTITFLRLRQSKWDVTQLFWSCDTIATGIDFIRCHWCWCYMMPTASYMASLFSLSKDNWNDIHHASFGHVAPLNSASHYVNIIINGTTAFLRSRQLKWGVTWLFWSHDAIGASVSIT